MVDVSATHIFKASKIMQENKGYKFYSTTKLWKTVRCPTDYKAMDWNVELDCGVA